MDPSIRHIPEPAQVIPTRAKPRREGEEGRRRFRLDENESDESPGEEQHPEEAEAPNVRRGETSVGHRLDGEAGSHMDVTA
ncbi:MAG: hypothetical protein GY711_04370 [bacterium]|nr:hypothetical protein [bacterium]